MTGHLVSSEAPSGRWRYENGPDQDSRSAGIGDEAVPVRVQAEGCRMKIGPNRKSRLRMARVLRTGLYVAYALPRLQGLYDAVNIKLDKCGGFTEALALANEARRLRFEIMVGNMCGTSLAMAPAFLVAQGARWADLDGPLLQSGDRDHAMKYEGGTVSPPSAELWG
jgi:hypothetical protein